LVLKNALMDFGVAPLFYFEDGHRAPARDVPLIALSKDTVEQAGSAEEAHTGVQSVNTVEDHSFFLRRWVQFLERSKVGDAECARD
jgi:hypothetical protein